jgi:CheY-like chemotaxis protein
MGHKHRILVVDDDVGIRALFSDVLRRIGARVTAASDGSDAVRRVQDGLRPCLVLADVLMPRLDGWELEREMRRLAPGVPVVLLTSDRLLSIRAPALDKPVSAAEIEALVQGSCAASRSRSGGRRQVAQQAG